MVALGASVCDDKGVMALPGERGCATSPRSYSISEKCLVLRQDRRPAEVAEFIYELGHLSPVPGSIPPRMQPAAVPAVKPLWPTCKGDHQSQGGMYEYRRLYGVRSTAASSSQQPSSLCE
jgi:hypothetical protein